MTVALNGEEVAKRIGEAFPDSVAGADQVAIVVANRSLYQVAEFLKNTSGLDFDYLNSLTAVDYLDYLEVVYHLTSLKHNHSLVLKTR